jgi:hypothetical protein
MAMACLKQYFDDPATAGVRYEAIRKERTSAVVRKSHETGSRRSIPRWPIMRKRWFPWQRNGSNPLPVSDSTGSTPMTLRRSKFKRNEKKPSCNRANLRSGSFSSSELPTLVLRRYRQNSSSSYGQRRAIWPFRSPRS